MRRRRRTVVDAAVVFLVILLIVQMWLLTATLEAYLAGNTGVALPGVVVSLFLFLGCFGPYRFVDRSIELGGGRSETFTNRRMRVLIAEEACNVRKANSVEAVS
jgi:hypothetical protein